MAQPDVRKVGRLVAVKNVVVNGTPRLRPARIIAVGGGTTVSAEVQTHNQTNEIYSLPQWSRTAPGTPGWIRT